MPLGEVSKDLAVISAVDNTIKHKYFGQEVDHERMFRHDFSAWDTIGNNFNGCFPRVRDRRSVYFFYI